MGIRRSHLSFEGRYVQIPNDWVRDERLSRRAKGMLVELMSHRVGWHITIAALQRTGPEGRDAIRTVVNELSAFGYLRRVQSRGDGGRFNEVEYELVEPPTADGKSDIGGFSDVGSADGGSPVVGESGGKEDYLPEHHLEEANQEASSSDAGASDPKVFSEDVVYLCDLLAALIRGNGNKVGTVGVTWWSAADRLMRLDGYTREQVEWVMRWTQANEFWQANVLSMPKFREQFDQLKTRAVNEKQKRRESQQRSLTNAEQAAVDYQQLYGGSDESGRSVPALSSGVSSR
ncbi:hypothetical protein [Curtobacterium sp. ISL-83]|uniref:hypothetical protein n=1 Tax=Curtobacterium sp. ISL-83 TaxID=2819145 RepID=UPI001BE94067|nr:hypothetical protein [Curtobacterium sp. ISL-83]MBT2503001.1 hypothetical protein [Curtobacterium sp. ISL-83]